MKNIIIVFFSLIFILPNGNRDNNYTFLNSKQKTTMHDKSYNIVLLKNELYNAIYELDSIYKDVGKEIYFSEAYDYYVWYKTSDSVRESVKISDSDRTGIIEESLKNNALRNVISKGYLERINILYNSIEDPINLGFLFTKHKLGKSLLNILSDRYFLNSFEDITEDDPSRGMSEKDYIDYHKERIHIINENRAIYKNKDAEISLEENFDVCYFTFIKENDKWLLDNIEICSRDQEEEYDIKLIGESKPITYYEAEVYDFEE